MLTDVAPERIRVELERESIVLNLRRSPAGRPPLLLLHGHPQTHVMWHRVWPMLQSRYTLIAPDLRGYGDSDKPSGKPDHCNYSKRTMAADLVALMRQLGYERFAILAHDRGARVAFRLGLDHAGAVESLTLLDIAPTLAMFEQTSDVFARAYWHWFFLSQPFPLPETLIGSNGPLYVRSVLGGRHAGLAPFPPHILAEYERCASDPATVHGICEDYRAAASIDLVHDRSDRDTGRRLAPPLLALWAEHGIVGRCFDVLDEWRRVATNVQGQSVPCGHYIAEEVPEQMFDLTVPFINRYIGSTP